MFADWRYDATGAAEARLHPEQARSRGLRDPGRRPQLRLRLVARTCAMGAAGLRLSRRHQHRDRRHLSQQLAEERPAADRGRRADARLAARQSGRVTCASTSNRPRCTLPNGATASFPSRLRALLPAERHRRARLPAEQRRRHRRVTNGRHAHERIKASIVILGGDGIGPKSRTKACACWKRSPAASVTTSASKRI